MEGWQRGNERRARGWAGVCGFFYMVHCRGDCKFRYPFVGKGPFPVVDDLPECEVVGGDKTKRKREEREDCVRCDERN